MLNIHDMSADDKRMYWNGSLVFDKDTKEAFTVEDYTGSWKLRSVSSGQTVGVSNKNFVERYITYRDRLGWRNLEGYCMYAEAMPGRSNRKGVTPREIVLTSPLYDSLAKAYVRMRHLWYRENPTEINPEVQDMSTLLSLISYTNPPDRHQAYLSAPGSLYYTRDEACDLVLKGARVGAAINPSWAISCTKDYYDGSAALFYNKTVVGVVTPDSVDFLVSPDSIEPAWSRLA